MLFPAKLENPVWFWLFELALKLLLNPLLIGWFCKFILAFWFCRPNPENPEVLCEICASELALDANDLNPPPALDGVVVTKFEEL